VVLLGRGLFARSRGAAEERVAASSQVAPAWLGGAPAEEGGRWLVVGRGEPAPDRAGAIAAADDAALDELAARLAPVDATAPWRTVRTRALADLVRERASVAVGADGAELAAVRRDVAAARRRVAELVRRAGPERVPAERADSYWEQLRGPGGTEFVAWSRFALSAAQVQALQARYRERGEAMGVQAAEVPPALGWLADASDGVLAAEVAEDSPLGRGGLRAGDLIRTVDERAVRDVASWKRLVDEESARLAAAGGGALVAQAQRGRGAPFEARAPIAAVPVEAAPTEGTKHPKREHGAAKGHQAVRGNLWDDNPDE
jgi:hypothetical protein